MISVKVYTVESGRIDNFSLSVLNTYDTYTKKLHFISFIVIGLLHY